MAKKPKAPALNLTDAILKNMIDLERFSVYQQRQLGQIWKHSLEYAVGKLASQDLTQWNRERMSAYVKDVQHILDVNIDKIKGQAAKDALQLCRMQLEHIPGLLNGALGGVEVFHRIIFTEEKIRAMLQTGLAERRMVNLFSKLKANTRARFENYVNQTWNQSMAMKDLGMPFEQITRGMRDQLGPLEMSRREANLIHQSENQIAGNLTYEAIWEANADVLNGLQICVKMDGRECDICSPLAGKQYNFDFTPQEGAPHLPNGVGPLFHFRCRCCTVPVVKTYNELKKKSGPLTKRARGQLESLVPAEKMLWDGKPALPENPDEYIDWLKQLDEASQLEVLGQARYRLFKKGKLKARADLVHQQRRGLSLEDLKRKWELE